MQSDEPAVIAEQVGAADMPLQDSPFVKALYHASRFLVLRNKSCDLYTRCAVRVRMMLLFAISDRGLCFVVRMWCCCELVFAIKFGKTPLLAGPNSFSGADSSCLDADCWSKDDKNKIMQYITTQTSFKEVDEQIKTYRTMFINA